MDEIAIESTLDFPIERREAPLHHFALTLPRDRVFRSGSKPFGGEFLGAVAQGVRDVGVVQTNLAPISIDTANYEVDVRVVGVVGVDTYSPRL